LVEFGGLSMPVMKELKTPLKFLGIRYFKDENGIYYKKVGNNNRKTVRPFWKIKRIMLGVPLLFVLIIGFAGYKYGLNIASEKVMTEITKQITDEDIQQLLKDPTIQQIIEKEIGSEKTKELFEKYAVDIAVGNPDAKPDSGDQTTGDGTDNGSQDAAKQPINNGNAGETQQGNDNKDNTTTEPNLAFSTRDDVLKFLLGKFTMSELTELAKKSEGGINSQEKAEIRDSLLSRLTDEEYDAIKVFAVVELSKGGF
jgi:hypothetical protein